MAKPGAISCAHATVRQCSMRALRAHARKSRLVRRRG
jgi:hypothetical protein